MAKKHFVGFTEDFWRGRYAHFMAGYRTNTNNGRERRMLNTRLPMMLCFEEHCMGIATPDFHVSRKGPPGRTPALTLR